MKINIKKSLKFLTLLISALLIGTASAAIYNYMYMYATPVGVRGAYDVNFYEGADFVNASGSITNYRQTVTFTGMKGSNGTLATYTDPVRICNNGTVAHNIKLEIADYQYSTNADENLDYIIITIYNSGGTSVDSLRLDPHGDDGGNDLETAFNSLSGDHNWWRVQWDILWFGNATTSDTVDITLKITVES
ncbi:MAG: hypothetical protein QXI91_06510 [Candidatus Bathyarchaeia archaeon]